MQEFSNVSFKFEGNYLSTTFENNTEILSEQLEILTNSEIPGLLSAKKQIKGGGVRLLPTKKQAKNDSVRLYYDITSKLSLKQSVISRKISPYEYLSLCLKIIETCKQLSTYQLVNKGLLLDVNYIYVNPESFNAEFVYLPVYMEALSIQALTDFFRVLLFSNIVDITDSDFIQAIVDKLNQDYASMAQLEASITNLKNGCVDEPEITQISTKKKSWISKALLKLTGKSAPPSANPAPHAYKPINQAADTPNTANMLSQKQVVSVPAAESKSEERNPELDDYYATMLMPRENQPAEVPKLDHVKVSGKETIFLNISPFRIGKLPDRVHYVCTNSKISKIHAEFSIIENKVYVTDLNSLNGTYINGSEIRIQSNVPTFLKNNDKITFADEDFYLRI